MLTLANKSEPAIYKHFADALDSEIEMADAPSADTAG